MTTRTSMRPVTRLGLLVLLVALATGLAAGRARAADSFGVSSFTNSVSTSQAGAHPDATTSFTFNQDSTGTPIGNIKDIAVDLPPGFVGNPQAVPQCSFPDYATNNCAPSTQIGLLTLGILGNNVDFPLYNLVPEAGHPATFGTVVLIAHVLVQASVRDDGTYGLRTTIADNSRLLPITGSSLTLWGVPADHSHDLHRYVNGGLPTDPNTGDPVPVPANVPPKPFLTNPTDCTTGPLTTTLSVTSYGDPTHPLSYTAKTPTGPTGCGKLAIDPSITVAPDTTRADSPAAVDVDLRVPQNDDPTGLATPSLRDVSVALPAGMALSPAVASGLQGCRTQQFLSASCPNAAKIGTTSITSPLLDAPLTGGIYLATPTATQPYRIFLIASHSGVTLKLAGDVSPDPTTGRLITRFTNNPQQPVSDFLLHFFGGPHAALTTPQACGTFTTATRITAYSGQVATPSNAFNISSGCGTPFAPSFEAGVTSPVAGASSPFVLRVARNDGMSELRALNVSLPPGLSAHITGVGQCPAAQAAAAACPASSRVGSATVGAGSGSSPLFLPGTVYLTGPYAGAPLGLAIVVHALAGPFDLGTVVVRAAVRVDPHDAHLTIASDPLPRILAGVPLRLRDIRLSIDRAGFMRNPTSCAPSSVTATVASYGASSATVGNRFQVGDCAALSVRPRFSVKTSGARNPGGHPALTVKLTQGSGQATLRKVALTLPRALALNTNGISTACSPAQLAADRCPASTRFGSASAVSPLLPAPFSGPVYLVSGKGLPSLAVRLKGNGIAIDVDATTAVLKGGALRNTFPAVPDVPLSSFTLKLTGGRHSLLVNNRNLCKGTLRAQTSVTGHNGRTASGSPKLQPSGCSKKAKAKKPKSKKRRRG